jgi:uncharacterized membrane protein YgcG
MKNKLTFTLVGFVLCCASAFAQESSQTATANAPYAGATISDFKGKVSIQLPAQTFAAPVRGETLPPDTTVSTDDGRLLLKLSDGSDVLVRAHTKLLLKQPESNGWKYFQLLMGRVRTQIQKRMSGSPAFQIGTPSAVISVRGTKFDIEVDRRGFTEVDVDEGVVELEAVTGRGQSVLITAGFSSRVGMEGGPEAPRPTQDLRPQLDRPSRRDNGMTTLDDDDPIRNLRVSDQRDPGDHHGGDPDNGGHSSGSGDNDHSSGSGSGSGSQSGSGSGSDGDGDDHHHGGKPPGQI